MRISPFHAAAFLFVSACGGTAAAQTTQASGTVTLAAKAILDDYRSRAPAASVVAEPPKPSHRRR